MWTASVSKFPVWWKGEVPSKRLRLPLSELKFRSVKAEDGEKFLKIDSLSLHNAISVRLSDIKVISVGSVPEIPDPRQQEK